jgi:hypothetical protein
MLFICPVELNFFDDYDLIFCCVCNSPFSCHFKLRIKFEMHISHLNGYVEPFPSVKKSMNAVNMDLTIFCHIYICYDNLFIHSFLIILLVRGLIAETFVI